MRNIRREIEISRLRLIEIEADLKKIKRIFNIIYFTLGTALLFMIAGFILDIILISIISLLFFAAIIICLKCFIDTEQQLIDNARDINKNIESLKLELEYESRYARVHKGKIKLDE